MATTIENSTDVDFDEIDDARDHLEWLAVQLDKAGGELVVCYRKMSAEERRRRQQERVLAQKRADFERLKKELGET